ncbi:aryl-sulfate sulfotransferase [bacterium]|nr:aryl-sulfate sulfotransferase [bacterium]
MRHVLGIFGMSMLTVLMLMVSSSSSSGQIAPVSLPSDFFTYTITGNGEVAEGYYYFDMRVNNRDTGQTSNYMVTMDEEGDVLYYLRGGDTVVADFEPFENVNKFVWTLGPGNNTEMIYIMDDTYTLIDSLNSFNDLDIDGHEILLMDDGSMWTEYWRDYEIDMSEVVEGGLEDAIIRSHVILHLDEDQNIIWEWDSYNHLDELPLLDTDDLESLTGEEFEHLHTNSIEVDTDGNILLSNRRMSEVIKVKYGAGDGYEDGDVMWRFGGGSGNQFTLIDDIEPEGFRSQHDVRRLPNGNITVYDNGNYHETPTSYAREYAVDEENLTATLVWSYVHEPPIYSRATGSARRLGNGNTLINWGIGSATRLTEVTPEGDIAFELVPDSMYSSEVAGYRGFKSTMLGTAARPYITAIEGDTEVAVYLNFFGHDDIASYNVTFVNESTMEETTFNVEDNVTTITGMENGTVYTIYATSVSTGDEVSDPSNSIQVTPLVNSVEDEGTIIMPAGFVLQGNYPNPFNPSTTVRLTMNRPGTIKVGVYDVLGRQVTMLKEGVLTTGEHRFVFNPTHLASGVYIVQAQFESGATQAHRMVYIR